MRYPLHFLSARYLAAGLLALASLAGCYEREREKPAQPPEARILSDAELLPISPRQQAVRILAARIDRYHRYDSLGVSHPDPRGGGTAFFHGRKFHFATGAEERADLNRVLDSLRATGPLQMGRGSSDPQADTLPHLGPRVSDRTSSSLK